MCRFWIRKIGKVLDKLSNYLFFKHQSLSWSYLCIEFLPQIQNQITGHSYRLHHIIYLTKNSVALNDFSSL